MKIKPFRALYPHFEAGMSPETFCNAAKNAFSEYRAKGLYRFSPAEALFLYQIETPQRTHTGLVALNDLEAFFSGKIKQHEKTVGRREEQHVQLLLEWKAMLKPVLLTYTPAPDIERLLLELAQSQAPLLEAYFQTENQTHRIWAIEAPEQIRQLQYLFESEVDKVYIADGHHRTTTLAYLYQHCRAQFPELDFSHLYGAWFSSDQLDIRDFNRLVRLSDPENTAPRLLTQLREIADIEALEQAQKPQKKHELVMCLGQQWYRLRWKTAVLKQYAQQPVLLDVNLLNEKVLHDILGIDDVRNDPRITYLDGSGGWQALTNDPQQAAFMLYPVTLADMIRMADLGESLPPKSTYFEPRIKTGLLVKPFDRP